MLQFYFNQITNNNKENRDFFCVCVRIHTMLYGSNHGLGLVIPRQLVMAIPILKLWLFTFLFRALEPAHIYYRFLWWLRPVKNPSTMQENQVQSLGLEDPLEKGIMQFTPVFLPGKFHGQRSLPGYSPQDCEELDMTWLHNTKLYSSLKKIILGEG